MPETFREPEIAVRPCGDWVWPTPRRRDCVLGNRDLGWAPLTRLTRQTDPAIACGGGVCGSDGPFVRFNDAIVQTLMI